MIKSLRQTIKNHSLILEQQHLKIDKILIQVQYQLNRITFLSK